MCDTLALLIDGKTYFAKNSDREPLEPQRVEWHPEGDKDEELTYLTVDRCGIKYATWLSRPDWMWGAEIGMNEHGVCIGNEAVFTRLINRKTKSLLGMDLLRLALEESKTAEQALMSITSYLERYGQGGPAGFKDKSFYYDNSFLIADKNCVWQLETAGSFWVAKQFTHKDTPQQIAISNSLSIETDFDRASENIEQRTKALGYWNGQGKFNFKKTFATWFMPWAGRAEQRRQCNLDGLQRLDTSQPIPQQLSKLLKQHKKGDQHSSNADVCMHATSILRPSESTQSMIAMLSENEINVWMTGNSAPCMSLFKPLKMSADSLLTQPHYWEKWHSIYKKCEADKDKHDRLLAINKTAQQHLWAGSFEQQQVIVSDWWSQVSAL